MPIGPSGSALQAVKKPGAVPVLPTFSSTLSDSHQEGCEEIVAQIYGLWKQMHSRQVHFYVYLESKCIRFHLRGFEE